MIRAALPWLLGMALAGSLHAAPLSLDEALSRAKSGDRIAVARHYLAALVADREQQAANERLAVAYLAFDRARPAPDADVAPRIASLERELRYLEAREARSLARQRQHAERAALGALTGGIAGELDEAAAAKIIRRLPADLPAPDAPPPRHVPPGAATEWRTVLAEIHHLRQAVLPRLAKEDELHQLKLDKARDDLAAGREAALGAIMAEGSELAFRQAEADTRLALAILRLESLPGAAGAAAAK